MKDFLFLILAVATITGCNDDDIAPSNSKVVETLMTMYPNAQDISWGRASGYWVAEFDNVGDNLQAECTAWIDNDGKWYLTESDISFTALPAAVQDAYKVSDYAEWFVDDVDMIERYNSEVVYAIEADNEQGTDDVDVELYYTPSGTLLKSVTDNDSADFRPIILNEAVESYLEENYPTATIVNLSSGLGTVEVYVMDQSTLRTLIFGKEGRWMLTESRVTVAELPDAVIQAIAQSDYAAWNITKIILVESADKKYYQIELQSADNSTELDITPEGEIL